MPASCATVEISPVLCATRAWAGSPAGMPSLYSWAARIVSSSAVVPVRSARGEEVPVGARLVDGARERGREQGVDKVAHPSFSSLLQRPGVRLVARHPRQPEKPSFSVRRRASSSALPARMKGLVACSSAIVVGSVAVISASHAYSGMQQELMDMIPTITPEMFAGSPFEATYRQVAPDPGDAVTVDQDVERQARLFDVGAHGFAVRPEAFRHWNDALASRFEYIRYDARGCGLSDRDPGVKNEMGRPEHRFDEHIAGRRNRVGVVHAQVDTR